MHRLFLPATSAAGGKATTTVPTAGLVWRLGIVSTAATGTSTANIIWQPQYIISIE